MRDPGPANRAIQSVWYVGLPLSSAHRGSHSGGGAIISGIDGQEKYQNEGTVYPHASLMEMITYHELCFPEIEWTYLDLSHERWDEIQTRIRENPPDVVAFSVYTATYVWALIVAAAIKAANPNSTVVFGNDHASLLRSKILKGKYGSEVVDFIGLGNNGPFTMMNLIYYLRGQIDLNRVPSLCYARDDGELVEQPAPTYPLNRRRLPDYRLILNYLINHYDQAFHAWYADHYELKRMVTLAIDGGCTWGAHPKRRCKHCSIQGLTPKFADLDQIVTTLECVVGDLSSNVYAAGDSTLGFSSNQWRGQSSFLDHLADRCAASPILSRQRFLLAYGLVPEFLNAAELCRGFVRTWNVGIEAFDPQLLKADSKGVNRGAEQVLEAFELARQLDYRIYVSGILGLPGTTMSKLRKEVEQWLALVDEFGDIITTVSVSLPAVIPGSRMFWESITNCSKTRDFHGELLPCRQLSSLYIAKNTEVTIEDVEMAVHDVGRGVLGRAREMAVPIKFGGYNLGGKDAEERAERELLDQTFADLENRKPRAA